jgi:lysophospholipase L1-like esterase
MKTRIWLLVPLLVCGLANAAAAAVVACVGDSITYGSGIADRTNDSYPAQLERLLRPYDRNWQVRNFGVSGATLLRRGDKPYVNESAYNDARACLPDLVIIKLGTNDSKPQNWQYQADFVADYSALIDVFRALPSAPQVWICKPVPAFALAWGITPGIIRDEILPRIEQIARQKEVPVIDLYQALEGAGHLFPDNIHPNVAGAGVMAETIAACLLGVRVRPDFNGDWQVDIDDLVVLIEHWGRQEAALDLAPVPFGDGVVDRNDLAALMAYWQWKLYDPTLLAHWTLDEDSGAVAADRAGSHDGMLAGGALWQPQGGQIDGALWFDGVDDHVPTPFVCDPSQAPLSVFAWVKGGGLGQVILAQQKGSNWLLLDSAGRLATELRPARGGPLVSPAVITDGRWHRVGLTWNGSRRALYVDDIEVARDEKSLGSLTGSTAGLYLGTGSARAPGTFWSGLIDDIRIYNRVIGP